MTALEDWALPQLSALLPLEEHDLREIISYANSLPDSEASQHLNGLLGDSPQAVVFAAAFTKHRAEMAPSPNTNGSDKKDGSNFPTGQGSSSATNGNATSMKGSTSGQVASYAPPSVPPPSYGAASRPAGRNHTNAVIAAANVRARDEQQMQQALQNLQFQYGIYNSEIEPEHETDYYCSCPIHQYQTRKWARLNVQTMWSKAVMYPGEKAYNDNPYGSTIFSGNPYRYRVVSPYGYNKNGMWGRQGPSPNYHAQSIHQTIDLNNLLNREAQAKVDGNEPAHSIWADDALETAMSRLAVGGSKQPQRSDGKAPPEKGAGEKRQSLVPSDSGADRPKTSKMASFRKSFGIKSSEEKAVAKVVKAVGSGNALRDDILAEEAGRWPDEEWCQLVTSYQEKVGMLNMIADLRARKPIQYLHLLRAGYFEPIPVAWASQNSNPLKFSIESASGWRGLTPNWRGYEDTAEERLYWVLNHRVGSVGMRMKPDFISEMTMARDRMARAVEPPPMYFSASDVCHVQHTSEGYSKQVMPPPFRPVDRPEQPTDDTMILLDVSGSMDFDPLRPVYNQYLITSYAKSTQPKNKDVARAIIRRFTDAMANHDHSFAGYDLTTFANSASYIGSVTHRNLDTLWRSVRIGGGTRVMTGWQAVKDRHFRKHAESATHHPVYGWQAGPQTPILRLLLLLDGEATDMDEFELDLLGLSWAHVTIFLIGVDGCPHHHRHANELQRIGDVNPHVSFVDAQGNCPERFVTHELLKRHLGYEIGLREFEEMEQLPGYEA